MSEVAQCTRFRESKTYLGALLKVLLTLPLTSQDSTAIKRLRALVGKCREAGFASELPQEAPVLIAKGRSRIGRKGAKKSFPLLNIIKSLLLCVLRPCPTRKSMCVARYCLSLIRKLATLSSLYSVVGGRCKACASSSVLGRRRDDHHDIATSQKK